jgi:galactose oxidase
LPDGTVLVLSGSYIDPARPPGKQTVIVDLLQIWDNGTWKTIRQGNGTNLNFVGLPLYPRMHVVSDGQVCMSGSNAETLLLKTTQPGAWMGIGLREMNNRDYCPAVMYDKDKIIYIGGGNDPNTREAAREVEIMDLGRNPRAWRRTSSMKFRRRQHNAVILPDGAVLVAGGTQGGGGPNLGFNDLGPGQPVHVAEMWNPATETWTELAAEEVDRCYHATAVLLPDGRVLSAGSGEYRPDNVTPNEPQDSHRNAQVFSPPYLFKGKRPAITSAPQLIDYGDSFKVGTAQPNQIAKVSWIRLPSVTHSFDQNQRINFLDFTVNAGALSVTAPSSPNVCPPGHYMLFILDTAGVPSEAAIVQIQSAAAPVALATTHVENITVENLTAQPLLRLNVTGSGPAVELSLYAHETEIARSAKGTSVVLGITGTCPYGIGACWGGAYHALRRLENVGLVDPVPDTDNSTAEVFLEDAGLPDLVKWNEQFRGIVNGTYELRGVEVTLQGTMEKRGGPLFLAGKGPQPEIRLVPLVAEDKIQWDHNTRTYKPLAVEEASAYERLIAAFSGLPDGSSITVTGTLKQVDEGYLLCVRLFKIRASQLKTT